MTEYYVLISLVVWVAIGIGTLGLAINRYGYDPENDEMMPTSVVVLLWPISWCIIIMIIFRRIAARFKENAMHETPERWEAEGRVKSRPAVWCLDATCIAEFSSIDVALREWNDIDDGLFVRIGENEFWVNKNDICVMDEEEFNAL